MVGHHSGLRTAAAISPQSCVPMLLALAEAQVRCPTFFFEVGIPMVW